MWRDQDYLYYDEDNNKNNNTRVSTSRDQVKTRPIGQNRLNKVLMLPDPEGSKKRDQKRTTGCVLKRRGTTFEWQVKQTPQGVRSERLNEPDVFNVSAAVSWAGRICEKNGWVSDDDTPEPRDARLEVGRLLAPRFGTGGDRNPGFGSSE